MPHYSFVVFSDPKDGRLEEYNQWYDNVHLDEVLAVPGFVSARRYRAAPLPERQPAKFGHLAIYEIQSDDVQATLNELSARASNGMIITDALGETEATLYELITD